MTRREFLMLTSGLSPESVFWSALRNRPAAPLEGEAIDAYFKTQGF